MICTLFLYYLGCDLFVIHYGSCRFFNEKHFNYKTFVDGLQKHINCAEALRFLTYFA